MALSFGVNGSNPVDASTVWHEQQGRSPARPKQVALPVAKDPDDWERKTRYLSSMPAHLSSRIQERQPYHRTGPDADPLALLHDLEARSKHRALVDLWPLPAGSPLSTMIPQSMYPHADP